MITWIFFAQTQMVIMWKVNQWFVYGSLYEIAHNVNCQLICEEQIH